MTYPQIKLLEYNQTYGHEDGTNKKGGQPLNVLKVSGAQTQCVPSTEDLKGQETHQNFKCGIQPTSGYCSYLAPLRFDYISVPRSGTPLLFSSVI